MSMNKWKPHKLSEIGSVVGGATPSTTVDAYYNGDIPWLTPKDLSDFHERYIERGERNITKSGLNSCSAQLLPAGSVLFSSRAPIGYVAIAKNPIATNQGFKSIIPNPEKVDSLFLYYLLKYNKDNIEAMGSGTTFKEVSGATMKNIEVYLPEDLDEQRRIAEILGSLDDKIELNRRINANLEAQAQALFRSWFVDFEPFRDGPFVDSELGKIPQGWKVGNLLDIAELFDYKRKPLSSREREKMQKIYPYYGATSIMDFVDNYIFDGIYLLMGEDGSVANAHGYPYLQYVFGKFWPNNHAHVMQGKNGYTTEMLHCLLLKKNITSIVTGAVQPKISQANMKKILVPLPPDKVCSAFADLINPIYSTRRNSEKEISNLSALRDTLLPKLMAGEIKI